MKKKLLVIDATGANTYGAKYNIVSIVKYYGIHHTDNTRLLVYTSSDFLQDASSGHIRISNLSFCQNIYLRIIWSNLLLPLSAFFKGASIIYSPFDIGPFFSIGTKIILGIKNPNVLLPKHLVTLRYPVFHRFISYLSSFSADCYLYPSRFALMAVGNHFPNNDKKGHFIHHGIDLSDWQPDLTGKKVTISSRYIFFCSVLYKFKNIEVLFHSLKEINLRLSDDKFHLIVCGKFVSTEYEDTIKQLIISLGIEAHVTMVQNLDRASIVQYYRNAELIVVPTLFETFGHMYLESIQSGRPVIAADIPVAHEVLQNSALYFPATDYSALADLIVNQAYLINHKERSEKGFEILKSFTVEEECKKTLTLLFSQAD
ncbi:MAG: glycosyltransferase [Chitinophagaceae bacterium]|nr:glycosyltransferase [Chitinophagaceae bacterium]